MPLPLDDGNPVGRSDPSLLLMLALCTVLGAGTSLVAGTTTGIALMLITLFSVLLFASVRSWLPPALQAAAFVVFFTGCVTAMDLLLRARWPGLYREMGIFLPLAVAAGPLLAETEMFSSGSGTMSLKKVAAAGVVLACGATLLGGLREIGSGNGGFPFAFSPPGALIAMGILLAAWNALTGRGRNQ